MNIFLIGATGYIGSVVAEMLLAAGHSVQGLSRSVESDETLNSRGIVPVRAGIQDPASLQAPAASSDCVIFAGTTNDGGLDQAALAILLQAHKRVLYTSGVWILGDTAGKIYDENSPLNPAPIASWRPDAERMVLTAGGVVIRPAVVYGRGGGLCAMLVQSAKDSGAARFVGTGDNRWPLVDVEDLAELYALALEKAQPGALYLAADGPSYRVSEIAEAASYAGGAAGQTQSVPIEEARKQYGAPLADALVLDQQVSGEKAKRELGWKPQAASVLEELRYGSYALPGVSP
jgi:nucleoside-diphosphate-sugar epimerase